MNYIQNETYNEKIVLFPQSSVEIESVRYELREKPTTADKFDRGKCFSRSVYKQQLEKLNDLEFKLNSFQLDYCCGDYIEEYWVKFVNGSQISIIQRQIKLKPAFSELDKFEPQGPSPYNTIVPKVYRRDIDGNVITVTEDSDVMEVVFQNVGIPGAQGPKGPQGEAGPQGEVGPQGIQGIKGDTGSQGPKGDKGDKGDKGEVGAQGIQGIQGEKGEKGDTGDTGAQGPQGIQGIQGEVGPQGPQGLKGDKGDKGDDANVGNGTITINQGGTLKGTFTTNQNGNTTIDLSEGITSFKTINSTAITGTGNIEVQPTLVSGTNIKTISGASILGTGDLIPNTVMNQRNSASLMFWSGTQAQYDAITIKDPSTIYLIPE